MKRMTYFVMALALVLGFTQCKKEQPLEPTQTEGVRITLTVDGGNNGSKVIVDPTNNGANNYASVSFENGDIVYVGYNNAYVGTLTYSNGSFSGNVTISESVSSEYLHFYFLGGEGFTPVIDGNTATVVISDQTSKYPVISYAPSEQAFTGAGNYSAKLQNKCSIMKFNVDTPSLAAICITGMNNKVTVNFNPSTENTDQGFSYSVDATDGGLIKMPAKDAYNVTWAIVLPQDDLAAGAAGTVYTADNMFEGSRPLISEITANQYINAGKALTVNELTSLYTPLTFEALANGTISFRNRYECEVTYTVNGGAAQTIANDLEISVNAGDKVCFYGDNASYYHSPFHCTADCYIYGNIMSLIRKSDYANAKTLTSDHALHGLFDGNTHIVNHPSKTLVLPATTLTPSCYCSMFHKCTGLTTAPALPATTLANQCYDCMFMKCTSLETAPKLPAETLASSCYNQMFDGCSNLNSVTCLATDISAWYCTNNWLSGVKSSGTFTTPSSTSWTTESASGIPSGWTRVDSN